MPSAWINLSWNIEIFQFTAQPNCTTDAYKKRRNGATQKYKNTNLGRNWLDCCKLKATTVINLKADIEKFYIRETYWVRNFLKKIFIVLL